MCNNALTISTGAGLAIGSIYGAFPNKNKTKRIDNSIAYGVIGAITLPVVIYTMPFSIPITALFIYDRIKNIDDK